jgi:hypothetical protein
MPTSTLIQEGRLNFQLDTVCDILRRTPSVVAELLKGLNPQMARKNEGPDTFSAFDIVGHFIDGEETDWIPRARIILARGPDLRFVPYDRFRHYSRNTGRTLESLLDEFSSLRKANVDLLESWNLGPAELALPGEHPSLGRVTLQQLLAAWAVHDLEHLAQISRVLAKQYRFEVGPWTPYLPILTDHEHPRS